MSGTGRVRKMLRNNHQVLEVLPSDALVAAWSQATGRDISEVADLVKDAAGYVSPAVDAVVAAKLAQDLGWQGKVVTKRVGGKDYVIFKGRPGARTVFRGTRYLATNPKVVDMAIGKIGLKRSIVSGARLTIVLLVPLHVLRWILQDQRTMAQLIGPLATDLVKVGIGSALGAAAGLMAGATTLAVGPIVAAIVVGLLAGYALNAFDEKFGVTDRLIEALQPIDGAFRTGARIVTTLKRTIEWQALHGVPLGKGVFYP